MHIRVWSFIYIYYPVSFPYYDHLRSLDLCRLHLAGPSNLHISPMYFFLVKHTHTHIFDDITKIESPSGVKLITFRKLERNDAIWTKTHWSYLQCTCHHWTSLLYQHSTICSKADYDDIVDTYGVITDHNRKYMISNFLLFLSYQNIKMFISFMLIC